MQHLSKKRGVISVFLLIIFMITYVFMGLLVDAGRYQMAEAYVESALDNASNSILASYNQLLFDLYGLFSVDLDAKDEAEMEKKIKELYSHYLDEVLGGLDKENIDVSKYRTALEDVIFHYEEAAVSTKTLYDFKITELNAGSVVTLADTANVESQIIEHMKFRAPVQLVDDMNGFLKKMAAILEMTDRVKEAIKKTKITEKYNDLQKEADELLKDINDFAVALYHYTRKPYAAYGSIHTWAKPSKEKIYSEDPYQIRGIIDDFDTKLLIADQQYRASMQEEQKRYIKDLKDIIKELKEYLLEEFEKEDSAEEDIILSEKGAFSDIEEEEMDIKELESVTEEVNNKIQSKEAEAYKKFIKDYEKAVENHEKNEEKIQKIQKKAYEDAKAELEKNLWNIEDNARKLYEELNNLRDRIYDAVGGNEGYDAYIQELEEAKNSDGGSENKETLYAPDIELAKANAGEILKNLDLLMNSRKYLDEIGYGFENRGTLSEWLLELAQQVIIEHIPPAQDINAMTEQYLQYKISSYSLDGYTNGINSKNLYQNPSVAVTSELLPMVQGNLCVLYSFVSYFHDGHFHRDVDVNTNKVVEIKNNKDKIAPDKNQPSPAADAAQDSPELDLDNKEMRKGADYPDYLTVHYSSSVPDTKELDTEFEMPEEDVTVSTVSAILSTGLNLLEMLSDLLEGIRDNLYVDAYVISMLPNYYDYNLYNGGCKDDISGKGFTEEYQKYAASYAEAEYIITGAGANKKDGKEKVFSDKIKAAADGELAVGFGELSVSAMRTKLFGTRLLFNCIAIFTDSAKYSQASSLAAWAGPFSPLVTVVLMVAWAIAETVIDVIVLMGDNLEFSKALGAKDGQVVIFKHGADWFFSLEGAAKALVGLAVDELTKKITNQASKLVNSLESKANAMIYDAYSSVKTNVDEILDEVGEKGNQAITVWNQGLKNNLDNIEDQDGLDSAKFVAEELNNMNNFSDSINNIKEKADNAAGDLKEKAVAMVSRASDTLLEKAESTIKKGGEKVENFLCKNIDKVIPIGQVVNTGGGENSLTSVKMGYRDYLYFYLFTMNSELKLQRIQSVIQANLRVGGLKNFLMETSPASVWADLECTMKYMFLSDRIVPENIRKDGRLRLKVISGQSY